jgi:hypothetical protein
LEFRELDRVVVKGREEPVTLFEPIALSGRETPDEPKMVECYHRALGHTPIKRFLRVGCCDSRHPTVGVLTWRVLI